jgi:hypothetical protein
MCVFRIFSPGDNRGANREVYRLYPICITSHNDCKNAPEFFRKNRLLDTRVYACYADGLG